VTALTNDFIKGAANASQSLRHASFRAEGETDRFVARASFSTGNGANAAHGNREWVIGEGFKDVAAPLAQMPALRPSLCDAGSSGPTSLGDTRAQEEESGGLSSKTSASIVAPMVSTAWEWCRRRRRPRSLA